MSTLYEWFHDDITWCGNECSHTECERNIANRLSHEGLFSMALFKGTTTCPLYKEGKWVKVHGCSTAGGDPVYMCSICGKSEHVYGIEHPDRKDVCDNCGSRNYYPGEINEK